MVIFTIAGHSWLSSGLAREELQLCWALQQKKHWNMHARAVVVHRACGSVHTAQVRETPQPVNTRGRGSRRERATEGRAWLRTPVAKTRESAGLDVRDLILYEKLYLKRRLIPDHGP